MKPTLSFKTVPTETGPMHLLRVEGGKDANVAEYRLFPARPAGVKWAGPVYLAKNGTAWRVGRCNSGMLIAWKTVKISDPFAGEDYRMRSVPGGYLGDYCRGWSRNINGHTYDFSRVYWNGGRGGMSVTVRRLGEEIHKFYAPGPVLMKKD